MEAHCSRSLSTTVAIMNWGCNPDGNGSYEWFDLSPDGDGSGVVDPVKERAILEWAQAQVTAGKGFEGSKALPKLKEALGLDFRWPTIEQRVGQGKKGKKAKIKRIPAGVAARWKAFADALAAKLGEGES